MKRRKFLQSAAIGSLASLIDFPTFANKNENLAQTSVVNDLLWTNEQIGTPYVDSNLTIKHDGVVVVEEFFNNSGRIWPMNYVNYVEVFQMGVAGNEWPSGATGTLRVIKKSLTTGDTIMYENTTSFWTEGEIDSFSFYGDPNYVFTVECFTIFLS